MFQRPLSGVTGARRPRRLRSLAPLLAVGAACVVLPVIGPATQHVQPLAAETCPSTRDFQMVEANIKTGMTVPQTQYDLRRVYLDRPDFVAFNEMHNRPDDLIRAEGYELWRTPGKYTGANPVAWRTDRWTAIATGTIYVSNDPRKTAAQKTQLGIRYANWATLRSTDGCHTISIVAYHVAPKTYPVEHLLIPSVHKLGGLADFLAADGPVLLAGDLNRHYRARDYPRDLLSSYGMTPTWDMTGRHLPTGDHHGATIDYIFARQAVQFDVRRQITRELYSDHDAVVADLTLKSRVPVSRPAPTFVRGHVLNVPTSERAVARRAVVRRILQAVGMAPPGAMVQIATRRLGDPVLFKALRNAYGRGVSIQFVTTNPNPSAQEQALMTLLGSSKSRSSWAIERPYRSSAELPPTAVLVNRTADVQLLSVKVDQQADYTMSLRHARGELAVEREDFVALRSGFSRQAG